MISERSVILEIYERRAQDNSASNAQSCLVSNQCDILAFAFVKSGLQYNGGSRFDEERRSEGVEERFDKMFVNETFVVGMC